MTRDGAAAGPGKLRELFAIDLRSLAAFRICTALLILFDLAARVPFLEIFYTDQGLLPRFRVESWLSSSPLAIHYLGGSTSWEILLFGVTAALTAMLLLGFRTRATTVGLWVLMLSLAQRNPLVTDGGDWLLALLLFWSMFLPLGARWSLDAGRGRDGAVLSPASAALLLQPALFYLFAGVAKHSPAWQDGSALAFALGQSLWVKPLGIWLRQQDQLCAALSHFTHLFEIVAPLLLFSPLRTRHVRGVVLISLLGFQLGMGSCLELNLFPFYSSLSLVTFLPAGFWRRALRGPLSGLAVPAEGRPASLPERPLGRGARIAAGVVVAAFLLGCVDGLGYQLRRPLLLGPVSALLSVLGLEQHWDMYRDIPSVDVRVRSRGLLEDGSVIDFDTHGTGGSWDPMRRLMASYRGKAYLERFWSSGAGSHASFSNWVCREWNARPPGGRRLARIQLEREKIRLLPRGARGRPTYKLFYSEECKI